MKAQELRIGNYYNHNREAKQVTPSTIEEVWNEQREWCKPIPLTEEWLLKFGFIKSNNNTEFYTYDKGKISVHLKSKRYENGRTYFNSWRIIEKQPEHVHQLQNLYFALTSCELEIIFIP